MKTGVVSTAAARRAVAFHEAGHAVAAWRLDLGIAVATIVPGEEDGRHAAGHVRYAPPPVDRALFHVRALSRLIACFAGPAAQRLHNPRSRVRQGAFYDHEDADTLAALLSNSFEGERHILRWAEVEARCLIKNSWYAVEPLAEALFHRETMSGEEAIAVLEKVEAARTASREAARARILDEGLPPVDKLLREAAAARRRAKPLSRDRVAASFLRVLVDSMARGDVASIDLAGLSLAVRSNLAFRGFDDEVVTARLQQMVNRRKPFVGWRRVSSRELEF